uniref:Uncharacterized protein n=1 Tax=Ascaris lumbricoides TaxID=6252 RepID=A0A0M3HKF5_ASCLU
MASGSSFIGYGVREGDVRFSMVKHFHTCIELCDRNYHSKIGSITESNCFEQNWMKWVTQRGGEGEGISKVAAEVFVCRINRLFSYGRRLYVVESFCFLDVLIFVCAVK